MTVARWARPAALAAAAGLLAAGCGSQQTGCGLCGPVLVAPGDGVVWAGQGKSVLRLDPATGRIVGATAVMADRRGADVEALAARGSTGVAAWSGGQAIVGPSGRMLFRHGRRPPGYPFAAVSAGGRTWLAAGRRAIGLGPDATVAARPRLPARATAVAADAGVVWAVGGPVRPSTARGRRGTPVPAGPSPTRGDLPGLLAADATGVWVALNDPSRAQAVVRIDAATLGDAWRTPIPPT